MSEVESLLRAYEGFVRLPWDHGLAGAQKIWFAVYDPPQERRVRFRLPLFAVATKRAGHGWAHVDLTDAFAEWMASHEYRDAYFADPDAMDLALDDFAEAAAARVLTTLAAAEADEGMVVALSGLAALFGLTRASTLLERVAPRVRGRLLVFFPGRHDGSVYRLLDARDGWNYLAIPILATEER